MTIMEILTKVHCRELLLPEFQRDYVWKIEQIEDLFESILRGYPIGSFIFWKRTESELNQENLNFYYFIRNFEQGKTENESVPSRFGFEKDYYYIVLDGQQRISSLYIALYGSYTYFEAKPGRKKKDKWFKNTHLYYVDWNKKKFRCLDCKDEDYTKNKCYKVSDLVAKNEDELLTELKNQGFSDTAQKDLKTLLCQLKNTDMINYYPIENMDFDTALDVFVKINSTGTKLTKGDLIFSTLINGWENGKEKVNSLLKKITKKGFNFDRDYLMKACLFLTDEKLDVKINSFFQAASKIQNNWEKIKDSLDKMACTLEGLGFSKENMPANIANNATIPIAYYIYKGGSPYSDENKEGFKKFLAVAFAKTIFSKSTNTVLASIRKQLKESLDSNLTNFSLDLFNEKSFEVTQEDIDKWLTSKRKGREAYPLLLLLYPDLNPDRTYQQDHCHPVAKFQTNALKEIIKDDKDKIKDWQNKKELLPNLQFLQSSENQSKGDTELEEWVKEDPLKHKIEYLPEDKEVSLKLKDFESFFDTRRKEMKKKLMEIFEISDSDQNG